MRFRKEYPIFPSPSSLGKTFSCETAAPPPPPQQQEQCPDEDEAAAAVAAIWTYKITSDALEEEGYSSSFFGSARAHDVKHPIRDLPTFFLAFSFFLRVDLFPPKGP